MKLNWSDPLVTSDSHLCHEKIMDYVPSRRRKFKTLDEMNDTIIDNWKRLLRDGLIDMAVDSMSMTYFGRKFFFNHYYADDWCGKDKGAILIHGHEHGQVGIREQSVDVGIDNSYSEFRPQRLSKYLGLLTKHNKDK